MRRVDIRRDKFAERTRWMNEQPDLQSKRTLLLVKYAYRRVYVSKIVILFYVFHDLCFLQIHTRAIVRAVKGLLIEAHVREKEKRQNLADSLTLGLLGPACTQRSKMFIKISDQICEILVLQKTFVKVLRNPLLNNARNSH